MKVIATSMPGSDSAMAAVTDEPDPVRWKLLNGYLADCERNEDLALVELDRAEAGTPVLNIGNHYVWASMYPDGRVVIEQMESVNADEDEAQEPLPQIVITIAEARKLILDWIAARDKWYAEREAQQAEAEGRSK